MSLEIEYYNLKRAKEDVLVDSASVAPGDRLAVNFLSKVRVAAICGADNRGLVWVRGGYRKSRIQLTLYEAEGDEGRRISPDSEKPIKLAGQQALSILSKGGLKREVFICLDGDDDSEDAPVDPEGSKIPVLV